MCGSELVEQRATNDAEASGAGAPQHATARESKEVCREGEEGEGGGGAGEPTVWGGSGHVGGTL